MITIMVEIKEAKTFQKCDAYIMGVFEDKNPFATAYDEEVNKRMNHEILDLLEAKKIKAARKEACKLTPRKSDKLPFETVVVVGLGSKKDFDTGFLANAAGYGFQQLIDTAESAMTSLSALHMFTARERTEAVIQGALLGNDRVVHKKVALKKISSLLLLGEVDKHGLNDALAIVEGV